MGHMRSVCILKASNLLDFLGKMWYVTLSAIRRIILRGADLHEIFDVNMDYERYTREIQVFDILSWIVVRVRPNFKYQTSKNSDTYLALPQ
jgi:hypothetical protein